MLIPCAVWEINLHAGNFGGTLRDLGERKQIESANIAAVQQWLLLLLPAMLLSRSTVLQYTSAKAFSRNERHQRSFMSSLILKLLKFHCRETWNKPRHLKNIVRCGLLYHRTAGIKISFQWKSLTINHTFPKHPNHVDLCQDQVWTHTLMKAQAMQLCCFPLTSRVAFQDHKWQLMWRNTEVTGQAARWGNELWVNKVFTGFLAHKTPVITYIITSCTRLNLSALYKLKNTDISKPFIFYQIVL